MLREPACRNRSLALQYVNTMSRGILFLSTVLAIAIPGLAQETTATLLGTVTDPSGALMPNVTVRVTNLATNITRETKSDASGTYSLPFLPAGPAARPGPGPLP